MTKSESTPSTCEVSALPSGWHVSAPKSTPLAARDAVTTQPARIAWSHAEARCAYSSAVISRARSSMKSAPKMLTVLRSLPTVLRVRLDPFSTGSPSKSTMGLSCASTKTLDTLSPPPPAAGRLWQPLQKFASGAEMRLKLPGAVRRLRGSPVPVSSGRPAPSRELKPAVKIVRPCPRSSLRVKRPASISAWLMCC